MEIIANVRFLTGDEGGRHTPAKSGIRWPVWFGEKTSLGQPAFNDCSAYVDDREWMYPGDKYEIRLQPLVPEYVRELVRPGLEIEIWKGRKIADGTVVAVHADPAADMPGKQ